MMDQINQKLIKELQGNIPFEINPYYALAKKIGISEEEVVERLLSMKALNQLKRVSAILRHHKSGYLYNAMLVLQINPIIIKTVGEELSLNKLSSHCYERKSYKEWPYNFYAMLHSRNKYEIEKFVEEIVEKYKIKEYQILHTVRELKKTSMTYFL